MSTIQSPDTSKVAAGLQGAQLGTFVIMIDRNGMQALGILEHYDQDLDTFDVLLFDRKAEIRETTEQSVAPAPGSVFGGFGGHQINTVPTLRVQGAVYLWDPRIGQPRFILAWQNAQLLIDWISAANKAAQPIEGPAIDQPSEGTNVPGSSQAPAPEEKEKIPPEPLPANVVEMETPAIPPEQQKGKLPKDFPGRVALAASGITKFGQLKRQLKNLKDVSGIGEATAAKIKLALGE